MMERSKKEKKAEMNKKQFEELGKFFVDLGKYLFTAILFSKFFQDTWEVEWGWFVVVAILAITFVVLGLYIMHFCKKEGEKTSAPTTPTITEIKKGIFHIQHAEINN